MRRAAMSLKLNLVVAACNNQGIGAKGTLPWRLKEDLMFFKKVTSETTDENKQNAVIMGRKTWDSIPDKYRPLPDRINIVVSKNMTEPPANAYLASSFDKAIELTQSGALADKIESVFITGGSSIYKMALDHAHCHRIYMTRVLADFECDTFMPDFDTTIFQKIDVAHIPSEKKVENGLEFHFEVYEKVLTDPNRSSAMSAEEGTYRSFDVCVAMLPDRGIGKNGMISWPPIRKDYQHYMKLTSHTDDPNKKCVNIKGRVTWEETGEAEKSRPNIINIVISTTLRERPTHLHYLVKNFQEALTLVSTPPLAEQIERVWVMGGQETYTQALKSPCCRRIYLTKIFAQHQSDSFFPSFAEEDFKLIRDPTIEDGMQEENGTQFQFEVHERIRH